MDSLDDLAVTEAPAVKVSQDLNPVKLLLKEVSLTPLQKGGILEDLPLLALGDTFMTLEGWEVKSNGLFKGNIYSHHHYKDYLHINQKDYWHQEMLVLTLDENTYRLGKLYTFAE